MQAYKAIITYLAADKLKYEADLQNAINQTPLNDMLVRSILEKIVLNEAMIQKWVGYGSDETNNE